MASESGRMVNVEAMVLSPLGTLRRVLDLVTVSHLANNQKKFYAFFLAFFFEVLE